MDKDEQTKQTIQATGDALKQMMALSSGILTLEVTFLKDIIKALPVSAYWTLGLSWAALLLALIFGVLGLLALTGTISKRAKLTPRSIYATNLRVLAGGQVALFALGMTLTVVFGVMTLRNQAQATPPEQECTRTCLEISCLPCAAMAPKAPAGQPARNAPPAGSASPWPAASAPAPGP